MRPSKDAGQESGGRRPMVVIPAVDLREGACVQLVGGSYAEERVRLDDPLEVARRWAGCGFQRLHVVDLDAATGRGANTEVIRAIVDDGAITVQAGGGVRGREAIRRLLEDGVFQVVVGTRAVLDRDWLVRSAEEFPGRLLVAADVRERTVVTHGWTGTTDRDVFEVIETLNPLPLAGVLVTAVHREGRLEGTDLPLVRELCQRSRLPLSVAGGIRDLIELRTLSDLGVHAAILGMALYTGALDARTLVEEFVS